MVSACTLSKQKRSCRRGKELFVRVRDFYDLLRMKSCMDITEAPVRRHTDHVDAADCFGRYMLTVLMSQDCPVVPAAGLHTVRDAGYGRVIAQKYGGNRGCIDGPRLGSRYRPVPKRWFSE